MDGVGVRSIKPDSALLVQVQDMLLAEYAERHVRAVLVELKPSNYRKLIDELKMTGHSTGRQITSHNRMGLYVADFVTGRYARLAMDPSLGRDQVRIQWRADRHDLVRT